MNVRFLIDRLVQLQAGLLAELATSGGMRAPLAELSDQTFIHLAEELDRRGISRKVSADMFGMALRAYLKKIQRLAKSSTDNGTSLWQAVLEYLNKEGSASRAQILQRFCRDDEALVRAVLHDLTETGLSTCSGNGPQATYKLQPLETSRLADAETFADLIWLTIFVAGPISRDKLVERSHHRQEQCDAALAQLIEAGRISAMSGSDGVVQYESARFEIPPGQNAGWEAAILDHYQAMVRTILEVLPGLNGTGETGPSVGGFTYSLDVWPGHPLEEEVLATLGDLRKRLSDLRRRVDDYNESTRIPEAYSEVRIYGGQTVTHRSPQNPRTLLPPPPGPEEDE